MTTAHWIAGVVAYAAALLLIWAFFLRCRRRPEGNLMSTISKLNPRVRRARADRRSMIVALSSGGLTAAGMGLAQVLDRIRKDPRVSGAWKTELFEDNLTRYERKHGLDSEGRSVLVESRAAALQAVPEIAAP